MILNYYKDLHLFLCEVQTFILSIPQRNTVPVLSMIYLLYSTWISDGLRDKLLVSKCVITYKCTHRYRTPAYREALPPSK